MSKTTLRKTLATLTPEQKDELIVALYSARKEAKEYLEFFINPDIDTLIEKTTLAIVREVGKHGKHGYNKPRISVIRTLIKNVATLGVGPEYVVRLYVNTIHAAAIEASAGYWYTDAHVQSFKRLMAEALKEADYGAILEPTVARLRQILDAMPVNPAKRAASFMRQRLSNALAEGLEALASSRS